MRARKYHARMSDAQGSPGREPRFIPRLIYVTRHLNQAVRAAMDEALRPAGLSAPAFGVLRTLAADPSLSNAELARRTAVSSATMISTVRGLERRGLVTRTHDPRLGRIVQLSITPAGRELLDQVEERVAAAEAALLAPLEPAERDALLRTLWRIAGTQGDVVGLDDDRG
jgi:DNA-binding MarR family transcriptional regulator